jgi:hypothetical protein
MLYQGKQVISLYLLHEPTCRNTKEKKGKQDIPLFLPHEPTCRNTKEKKGAPEQKQLKK